MEINLVAEGLKFMVLGMVTVFMFLILLVYVLNLQARILGKYFPQKETKPQNPTPNSNSKDNKALVAAITAAVTEYKKS